MKKEEETMTNRPTNRGENTVKKSPQTPPSTKNVGNDSLHDSMENTLNPGEATKHTRIHPKRLKEMRSHLDERDAAVLNSIHQCRCLTSNQVCRLHFTDHTTQNAATRAANRNLKKLRDMHLIAPTKRRIGGMRKGSTQHIWHTTDPGERMLSLLFPDTHKPRRFIEPSERLLRHALAVAECSLQIREICARNDKLRFETLELEPPCWRPYSHIGKIVSLKPDLFAKTELTEDVDEVYEDCWFIEMDLGTESVSVILEQCRRYHDYYRTGLEQAKRKMFPMVVWIVRDSRRKDLLLKRIAEAFPGQPKLFTVILLEELEPLLCQGLEGVKLC